MNEIYKRIKQLREEKGYSQEELAAKLGYKNRSSIHKIESGVNDIPQSKIQAIADALDTTPAYLMGWDMVKEDNGMYYVSQDKQDIIEALDELNADDLKFVMDMIKKIKK
jgi:transcriptional regulator with XRE-family HTH domain